MTKVFTVCLQIADIRGGFRRVWTFADKGDAERWARTVLNHELARDDLPEIGADESIEAASDRWNTYQHEELCNPDEQAGFVDIEEAEVLPLGTVLDLEKESA